MEDRQIDREKVIKGLECHAEVNCAECPYRDGWRTCPFGETLLADAISLLKEQEAVEPIPSTDESDLWKCGNCNHQLFRCTHQRYCDMCGREVKWE